MSEANEIAASDAAPQYLDSERFAFTGNAKEYFGIWIVNLILTILTLGIYSAWAKVRRISYFHSNTVILGDRLAYHATGWMILKGRLIAFAAFALLYVTSFISPFLQLGLSLAIIPVIPWIINQSLRFQTRMTSWRNVRFNWDGSYLEALKAMILWPIAAVLSFGILAPMATKASHSFIARNLRLGKTPFEAELFAKPYYKVLGMTILLGLPIAVISGGVALLILPSVQSMANGDLGSQDPGLAVGIIVLNLFTFAWALALLFYYQVRMRNIFINALRLKEAAAFSTDMKARRILWITVTNTLVLPLTLLLMLPWAVVRLYRYTVESTLVSPRSDLPDFLDELGDGASAFGEEFGTMEGIDISL